MSGDCNDANDDAHPGAVEVCGDVADNDCDGDADCADSDCDGAPACVTTFDTGSLIIPMDVDANGQNNGMLRAYGLVYELLRNGVPVFWTIGPLKSAMGTTSRSPRARSKTCGPAPSWRCLAPTGAAPSSSPRRIRSRTGDRPGVASDGQRPDLRP